MDQNLIIVALLLGLAVVGLVVGVSNDAVNFMNSAIGSNAAKRKWIVLTAGLGILAGVAFSGGMMEVARKGIFNPQFFEMEELLVIFMAVVLQNILLLDLFNTFGLPTSTTVSVVFGLFGGALAVSMVKVIDGGHSFDMIFTYLNTNSVIKIIGAIFLSILIAFVVGAIVQYFTRLILTFEYKDKFKKFGAILGSVALTAITFFILFKGAKGAFFMTKETVAWMNENTWTMILWNFAGWAFILQILMSVFKVNILKVIVMVGTFSLAMAFSANDLVNFIGAPLAGLNAFQLAENSLPMENLANKVPANTAILMISGFVMAATLFLSKKARTVTRTELSLGRQEEGHERFESNTLARAIVRMVIVVVDAVTKIFPKSFREKIAKRFDNSKFIPEVNESGETQMFDLIRAAVILMVSSALIAFATSQKLPLSTTYVTFIVAMAAALPDKSWGRDSAVYRVSGVLTVIGGWFFTALMGTVMAMIIGFVLYFGGFFAVIAMTALAIFLMYRTARLHKKREKEAQEEIKQAKKKEGTPAELVAEQLREMGKVTETIVDVVDNTFDALCFDDFKKSKRSRKRARKTEKNIALIVSNLLRNTKHLPKEKKSLSHKFYRPISAIQGAGYHLHNLAKNNFDYIDNGHELFSEEQAKDIKGLIKDFNNVMLKVAVSYKEMNFDKLEQLAKQCEQVKEKVFEASSNQMNRVHESSINIRRSRLFLEGLSEVETILDDYIVICNNTRNIFNAFHENKTNGSAEKETEKSVNISSNN